jgi:hemerythrin-like metal-binding protein
MHPEFIITRESSYKLYEYLKKWLTAHILKEDLKYSEEIKNHHKELNHFFEKHAFDDLFRITDEQHNLYYYIIRKEHLPPKPTKKSLLQDKIRDTWFRFKLKLDIPIIDIQHLWLIHLVFRFENALHSQILEKKKEIEFILNEAITYVSEHFKTEEFLLERLNYPQLAPHIKAHNLLVDSVLDKKSLILGGDHRLATQLCIDLKEWLFSHIALEDKKFINLLQENKIEALKITKKLLSNKVIHITKKQMELYKDINYI